MIDMDRPTNFKRTDEQLQTFLMACICVAGKTAHVQAKKLELFLSLCRGRSPFDKVRRALKARELFRKLLESKIGKYNLMFESFRALAEGRLDLRTVTWQELTLYPGIGEKTAKFFVLHSRPGEQIAVLDTHMQKTLYTLGYDPPTFPPTTRNGYAFWERKVLEHARLSNSEPHAFDLHAWKRFRRPSPFLKTLSH